MKLRSLVGGALALAAATVLLTSCAAPIPAPAHAHSSTAPTPTPTPTAASAPGSRVPVGCADLLGAANVSALAGANAQVSHDENSAPTNLGSAAQLQYGAEDCIWDGENTGTGSAPGAYLNVTVAPDAKAAFASRFAELMSTTAPGPAHPAATENVAGDSSGFWCANDLDALGTDGPSLTCDAEIMVKGYWVSITVGDVSGWTQSQLADALTKSLVHSAAQLTAAPPVAGKWVGPSTPPPAFCTDPGSTATVRTILGDQTLAVYPVGKQDVYAQSIGTVGPDVDCTWTSSSYGTLDVEILAGGSWIFPNFAPTPRAADIVQSFSPVNVPGVSSAFLGTGEGGAEAYLEVGSSAVSIAMNDMGAAKNVAALAAFAKAIAAS